MSSNKYIINRSNYTVKEKHKEIRDGVVFERDFMTTTAPGSWEGDVFTYNEGNFKMTRRESKNAQRKHGFGDWQKGGCNETPEIWTEECLVDNPPSTDGTIKLKPNLGNIRDYAYFGSLYERLRATVSWIAAFFPAEIYLTASQNLSYGDKNGTLRKLGYNISGDLSSAGVSSKLSGIIGPSNVSAYSASNLSISSNPMGVDVMTISLNDFNDVPNKMRYFCEEGRKYSIMKGDLSYGCPCDWEVVYKTEGCSDGQLTGVAVMKKNFVPAQSSSVSAIVFFEYYLSGTYYLLSHKAYNGYSIRPLDDEGKIDYYEEFFDNLDDFGKVLLNRYSNPKYTCYIDYPEETELGVESRKRRFTWPTLYGYNLDVISNTFKDDYLGGLMKLCEFYDNGYTDNAWNRMTHDSIKNMDKTYIINGERPEDDSYSISTARIEALVRIFGRFMDEIKYRAANIKYTNRISYDGYSNLPDYFLSDTLQLSGWDVTSATNGLEGNIVEIDNRKWDYNNANVEFMRRLKLNSREILSKKGTKMGMEELLGLYGLVSYDFARAYYNQDCVKNARVLSGQTFDQVSDETKRQLYDYKIDQYVSVAASSSTMNVEEIERYNKLKRGYDIDNDDTMQGLPCRIVEYSGGRYLVPWCKDVKEMDGGVYFQMYGGWEKEADRVVDGVSIYDYDGRGIYGETVKYLKVVHSIADLANIPFTKLHDGDVCYVYDMTDFDDYFGEYNEPPTNNEVDLWADYVFYYNNKDKINEEVDRSYIENILSVIGTNSLATLIDYIDDSSSSVKGLEYDRYSDYTFYTPDGIEMATGEAKMVMSRLDSDLRTFVDDINDGSVRDYKYIKTNGYQLYWNGSGERLNMAEISTALASTNSASVTELVGKINNHTIRNIGYESLRAEILTRSVPHSEYIFKKGPITLTDAQVANLLKTLGTTKEGLAELIDSGLNTMSCGYDYMFAQDMVVMSEQQVEHYMRANSFETKAEMFDGINSDPSGSTIMAIKYVTVSKSGIPMSSGEMAEMARETNIDPSDVQYLVDNGYRSLTYTVEEQEDVSATTPSHYFYIGDANNCGWYGYDSLSGKYGWENVTEEDITNGQVMGMRVLYLESILDESKGNNPHTGYGNYDNGEAYLDYFRRIFKYAIDNDIFTDDAYICSDGDIDQSIKDAGFELTENKDNMKCWYFSDTVRTDQIYVKTGSSNATLDTAPAVGDDATFNFYESSLDLDNSNYEGTGPNNEAAAFNVINEKKMVLSFDGFKVKDASFRTYFEKSIAPYLFQMIPSTTILEVRFVSDNAVYTNSVATRMAKAVGKSDDTIINTYYHNK